jgi:hypothetical protein
VLLVAVLLIRSLFGAITTLISTDGIENVENKLGISTNLQMMLWSCQLLSQELGGLCMVR